MSISKNHHKIVRDSDGMTPRQQVDTNKARLLALEIAEKERTLVPREEVEAGMREAAEIVQSDIFGALPQRLAGLLENKKQSAEEIRGIIMREIGEMVRNWKDAELIAETK